MQTRLENFGAAGIGRDPFETGLGPAWSWLTNVDIRNGDLYSAGADVARREPAPIAPLYPYLFESGGTVYDVVSDGQSLYVWQGEWTEVATGLGPGPVSYTVFRGCLIVNTGTGPYYWCAGRGVDINDTWDNGADVSWDTGPDETWADGPGLKLDDTWDTGDDETWADGEDVPWDNVKTSPFQLLPGWNEGDVALQVIAYKDQLVAIGGTAADIGDGELPYLVRWSSLAPAGSIPSSWSPAVGNFAGFQFVQDTQGEIAGAALMRDDLIIYKTDSIWRLTATGDANLPMVLERIMTCNGVESPSAITVCAEMHFLTTKRGFIVFDGNQTRPLDFGKIQSALIRALVGDTFETVQTAYFAPQKEVWIAFRSSREDPFFAGVIKYNTQHNAFSFSEYTGKRLVAVTQGRISAEAASEDTWDDGPDETWDGGENKTWDVVDPAAAADVVLMAFQNTSTGQLATYDVDGAPVYVDGSPKTCTALRYGVRLADSTRLAILRGIYPEMEGETVDFSVGVSWYPSQETTGNAVWQSPRQFTPGSRRKIPYRLLGDTFALQIVSSGSPWRLHALTMDHAPAGET